MIDMHVHTDDSPDAEIPAAELVLRGMEEGLEAIGFVAHVDYNPDDYCYDSFCSTTYDQSIASAAEVAAGKLTVLKGIEVGEPHVYQERVKKTLDYGDYDFITGALHTVEGVGMVLGEEAFREGNPLSVVEMYYKEILTMVETADIDILAHMGLFRRGMAIAGHDTDFNELDLWPNLISRILEVLMDRGITLELNTSGLRRRERSTYPIPAIIDLYGRNGGTLVTLGSDTHRERHRYYGLARGAEVLMSAGFSDVTLICNRQPESLPLIAACS